MKYENIITQKNTERSLQAYEQIIEGGLQTFVQVGEALMKIKEKKLYKVSHSNFGDYCKERWNFTQQHAGRLITGSIITKQIESEPNGSVLPQSESQTRALAKSKNSDTTWKDVQKVTGKEQPTAKEIEAFLKERADQDTLDAEIIEEVHMHEETNNVPHSLLSDLLNKEYGMGHKTGRPQVSVSVDDDTCNRLDKLKDNLQRPKASVVAQALLLMETVLDLQDQPPSHNSKQKSLFDPNSDLAAKSGV